MVILDNYRTAHTAPAVFVAFSGADANFSVYSLYDTSLKVAIGGLIRCWWDCFYSKLLKAFKFNDLRAFVI